MSSLTESFYGRQSYLIYSYNRTADSMVSQAASSSEPAALTGWTPPSTIQARSVLPDRYTDPSELQHLVGKETDPSRMGIFVCLLDERPHLHPNLPALHKHRLVAHSIPLPPDPNNDLPISQLTVTEGKEVKQEWFTWKYSEEEELRRKAYLPLS